jgi:hypothetical protein
MGAVEFKSRRPDSTELKASSAILLAVLFTSAEPDDGKRRDRERDYPNPDDFHRDGLFPCYSY